MAAKSKSFTETGTTVHYYSGYMPDAEIPDNMRRGEPLPGCDCVRCFGRCIIDRDVTRRETPGIPATGIVEAE